MDAIVYLTLEQAKAIHAKTIEYSGGGTSEHYDLLTLVPLSLYFKGSMVKVQLGLCKGKQLHDKRAVAAKRDANRAIDRALKEQNR